ncbi:MAG: hypothetical protein A3K19_18850 [Lentisphaerae bacterium RIFOXYB12_FULL_65_16]|nr:MAG: hypothetical protein A3K18_12955 [Lentisphaerae bacterium RIFOXYA12_64_32]OGV86825.1 MAG: hypothetical protein A3K19_18850 [Lentisphaerae bacterium RIFOXYB12_FULL_65_16]
MFSFLANLFRRPNPTEFWKRRPDVRLFADLAKKALTNATIGDPLECCAFLGPVEDTRALHEHHALRYLSLGLDIGLDENDKHVTDFRLVWDDYLGEGFTPFPGEIAWGTASRQLSCHTTMTELVAWLGEPYWTATDTDETILFYEHGPIEWEIELTPAGTLKHWLVVPPLLADAAQRQAYGVTKPWPPAE